jgi:hypothetical protein
MPWRTITETDLTTAISQTELDTLRRALGADGADTIALTLNLLSDEIRGYCSAAGADLDSTAYSVPPSLIGRAVAMAIIRISTRAGGVLPDPKGLRAKAAEAAEKFFAEQVARGHYAIETAVTPSSAPVTNKPAGPSVRTKTLRIQKDDQDGA